MGSRIADSIDGWLRRVRHALRGLARRPAFALTVVLTLALGIGATTAIFSVVDGVLLEPLPYPDGRQLVYVWGRTADSDQLLLSGPQAAEAVEIDAFSEAARIFGALSASMQRGDLPEPIRIRVVSHNFFDLFGIRPLLGRGFVTEDEFKLSSTQQRDPDFQWPVGAMVLSYSFWQGTFGGDPNVLGRVVSVGGRAKQIVGVMPPGFRTSLPAQLGEEAVEDAWVMSAWDQSSFPRDTRFVRVIGRLKDGLRLDDAQRDLAALSSWQRQTFAEDARDEFTMRGALLQQEVGATARTPLLLLLGAVGFVLLIACANVAMILLARSGDREGELRIRRALGAGRGELAKIALADSLAASVLGGGLGVLLAPLLTRLILGFAPSDLPRTDAIGVDGSVLLFSAAVTLSVALAAGLLPALLSSKSSLLPDQSTRLTASRRRHLVGKALVASEVGLAVILATGTGLMLRSLGNVLSVDPGFEPGGLVTWQAGLTTPSHPTWESRVRYFRGVQESILGEAGVSAVGILNPAPFEGVDRAEVRIGMGEDAVRILADYRRTSPGALEALGLQPVSGRLLEWPDLKDFDRLHAVVDSRFAEQAWPGRSAVGEVISLVRREYQGSRVWDEWKRVEVVGVVEPIRGTDLRHDDLPTVYVSYSQNMWGSPSFLARAGNGLTIGQVRAASGRVDAAPLVQGFSSIEALAGTRLASLRFALTLVGTFGALGLVIAATGVYGLLAYSVNNRKRELHIRAALGADRRRLAALVIRSGLFVTTLGILGGWAGAWVLTRFLTSYLFEVAPTDPATFLAVAGFLMAAATLACWVPSRRAGRAEPAAALR